MMTANVVRPVRVVRISPDGPLDRADVTATEEPMEVRINGESFAVIMRTPGADRELAAGFLFAERVIRSHGDIAAMDRNPELRNVIDVRLDATTGVPDPDERRRVVTSSSCGLCGRVTIESLQIEAPPIDAEWAAPASVLSAIPDRLRSAQAIFSETGGLHAAGLFDRSGALETAAEDVGRHNAVDKVIGRMLLDGRVPLHDSILFVSGRASYEIVQKAFLAGIPIVGAVSAPSSLAVELADQAGITLLGFVRGVSFNLYANAHRVTS
jgi:FdhD protein